MSKLTRSTFVFLYILFGALLMVSIINKEAKYALILVLPIIALTFLLQGFHNAIQQKKSLDAIKKELKSTKRKEKKLKKKLVQTENNVKNKKKDYHKLTTNIQQQKKEQQKLEKQLKLLQQKSDALQPLKVKTKHLHLVEKELNAKKKELIIVKKQLTTYQRVLKKIHHLLVEDELRKVDKMTGRQFEVYLSKILTLNGYQTKVTKASGDQGVDIIAKKNGRSYAIQAKRYKYPVSNHAVQEVFSGKKYYDLQYAVVATNNTFTKSAKELAEKTHVTLMERKHVRQLIKNAIKIKPSLFLS